MKIKSYFPQKTDISAREEQALQLKKKGFSHRIIRILADFHEATSRLLDDSLIHYFKKVENLPAQQRDYCLLAWVAYYFHHQSGRTGVNEPEWLYEFLKKIRWLFVLESIDQEGNPLFPVDQLDTFWIRVGQVINLEEDLAGYKERVKKLKPFIRYQMFLALLWDDETLEELSGFHPELIRKKIITDWALDYKESEVFKKERDICNIIGFALIGRWEEEGVRFLQTLDLTNLEQWHTTPLLFILLQAAPQLFIELMKDFPRDRFFQFLKVAKDPKNAMGFNFNTLPINYPPGFFKGAHLKDELNSILSGQPETEYPEQEILHFYQLYKMWDLLAPVIIEQKLTTELLEWFLSTEINPEQISPCLEPVRNALPEFYGKYNYQSIIARLLVPLIKDEWHIIMKKIEEIKKTFHSSGSHALIPLSSIQTLIHEFLLSTFNFSILFDLYKTFPFVCDKSWEYLSLVLKHSKDVSFSLIVNQYISFLKSLKRVYNSRINFGLNHLFQIIAEQAPLPHDNYKLIFKGTELIKKHFPVQENWDRIFYSGNYIKENHKELIDVALDEYHDLDYKSRMILAATGEQRVLPFLHKHLTDRWVSLVLILLSRLVRETYYSPLKLWSLLFKSMRNIVRPVTGNQLLRYLPLPSTVPQYTYREAFIGFYESIMDWEELISRLLNSGIFKTKKKGNLDSYFGQVLYFLQDTMKKITYEKVSFFPYSLWFLPWHEDLREGLCQVYRKVKKLKHRFPWKKDIRRLFWLLILYFTREETAGYFKGIVSDEDKQIAIQEASRRLDDLRKQASLASQDENAGTGELEDMIKAFTLLCLLKTPVVGIKKLLLAFRSLTTCVIPEDLDLSKSWNTKNSPETKSPWTQLPRLIHSIFKSSNDLEAPEQLRKELAVFFVDKLKPLKKQKGRIKEPFPLWQETYIHAIAALGVNPGGKLHCVLEKVIVTTPHENVKDTAEGAVKKMKSLHRSVKKGSHKRYLLNTWWFLRYAHCLSFKKKVDRKKALIVKRKEVRE